MVDSATDPAPGAASSSPGNPGRAPDGLPASLQSLWRDLPGLVNDRVELLSLELQSAGLALLQIVMLVVVVAILGVTAWIVLWVGIVTALVALGLPLGWALLAALLLNVLAAAIALARVRRLLPRLKLSATRRHLMFSPSPQPPTPCLLYTSDAADE